MYKNNLFKKIILCDKKNLQSFVDYHSFEEKRLILKRLEDDFNIHFLALEDFTFIKGIIAL